MNNKARRQSFEVVEKAPGGVRGREGEKGKATLADGERLRVICTLGGSHRR